MRRRQTLIGDPPRPLATMPRRVVAFETSPSGFLLPRFPLAVGMSERLRLLRLDAQTQIVTRVSPASKEAAQGEPSRLIDMAYATQCRQSPTLGQ